MSTRASRTTIHRLFGSTFNRYERWIIGAAVTSSLCGQSRTAKRRQQQSVSCCGIIAYVGEGDAERVLLEGISVLQNRGYDSCGLSTVAPLPSGNSENTNRGRNGILVTTKRASCGILGDCVDRVRKECATEGRHAGHHIGIGHTRWATHGGKTDRNAHPHHDFRDRISLIHNGTLDNYLELRQRVAAAGIQFRSDTDSEIIAHLIGLYLDSALPFEEAARRAIAELQGTWGLCILHRDYPDRLVIACNGSPILVAASSGDPPAVVVASEPAALSSYASHYFALRDGEIAVVTCAGIHHLSSLHQLLPVPRDPSDDFACVSFPREHSYFTSTESSSQIDDSISQGTQRSSTTPWPFEYWTEKEIFEQPQSLARALNYGGRVAGRIKLGGLDRERETLLGIRNLLLVGCGTSLYAAMYGQLLMEDLGCFDSCRAIDASEVELHSFPRTDPGLLLISQSGETLDTIRAAQLAEPLGIKLISVVNAVGSLLARLTNCGVYLNAGREVAVASTKSFSSQVTVLALIGAWFAQHRPLTSSQYSPIATSNHLQDQSQLAHSTSVTCCSSNPAHHCHSCLHSKTTNLVTSPIHTSSSVAFPLESSTSCSNELCATTSNISSTGALTSASDPTFHTLNSSVASTDSTSPLNSNMLSITKNSIVMQKITDNTPVSIGIPASGSADVLECCHMSQAGAVAVDDRRCNTIGSSIEHSTGFQTDRMPGRLRGLLEAIERLPVYAGATLQSCMEQCRSVAQLLKDAEHMFIVGKGYGYPAALEGALKLKEVAYIHAEGFPAGALKHGPFAIVEENRRTPAILLVLADRHAPLMVNCAEQLHARGARIICITDDPRLVYHIADDIISIPGNGPLTALLAVLSLQLLALHIAKVKNINPDKPRGLAKAVTVL